MFNYYSVVLTGGGARGAVQVGMLKAIKDSKIKVSEVIGTSVGAINGAWFAYSKPIDELEEIWLNANKKDIFPSNPLSYIKGLLYKNHTVGNAGLQKFVNLLPDETIEKADIPLTVMTTKLITGDTVPHRTGNLRQIVLASCSIPGVFKPVLITGEEHIDGCVTAMAPYEYTKKRLFKKTLVLDASGLTIQQPRSAFDVFRTGFNHSMRKDLKFDNKNIYFITPKSDIFNKHDGRSFDSTKDLLDIGYNEMKNYINTMNL